MIIGNSSEDHIKSMKKMLDLFGKSNLKLRLEMFLLFQKEIKFLGKIVSGQGIVGAGLSSCRCINLRVKYWI